MCIHAVFSRYGFGTRDRHDRVARTSPSAVVLLFRLAWLVVASIIAGERDKMYRVVELPFFFEIPHVPMVRCWYWIWLLCGWPASGSNGCTGRRNWQQSQRQVVKEDEWTCSNLPEHELVVEGLVQALRHYDRIGCRDRASADGAG